MTTKKKTSRAGKPVPGTVRIDPERLANLRKARFLSIRELADKAGVAVWTVMSAESGVRLGSQPSTVRKLAEALDSSPDELVMGEDEENDH